MAKVFIKGLNVCPHRRQNLYHYKKFAENAGAEITYKPEEADLILVWTCGFRSDVIENSISELNRYSGEYKGEVIALGCLPDIDRKRLEGGFAGRIVSWRREGDFFDTFFNMPSGSFDAARPVFAEPSLCEDAAEYRRRNPSSDATFADQFLKIMITQGCLFDCSYCTEKLCFPPFRSVKKELLIESCRDLILKGEKKIILIGDSLGNYGEDIGSSLPDLIRSLADEFEGVSFALQNMHPLSFMKYFGDMVDLIREGYIFHVNLPIQSASDNVLGMMNRGYGRRELEIIFSELRGFGGVTYDTHIIIGFPGESDDDFNDTVDFLKEYKPNYVLISKYYDAPGTGASKLPGKVPAGVVENRLKIVEDAVKELGIIYNIDGAGIMKDRLKRINSKLKSI